jgi:hypothetical protein
VSLVAQNEIVFSRVPTRSGSGERIITGLPGAPCLRIALHRPDCRPGRQTFIFPDKARIVQAAIEQAKELRLGKPSAQRVFPCGILEGPRMDVHVWVRHESDGPLVLFAARTKAGDRITNRPTTLSGEEIDALDRALAWLVFENEARARAA